MLRDSASWRASAAGCFGQFALGSAGPRRLDERLIFAEYRSFNRPNPRWFQGGTRNASIPVHCVSNPSPRQSAACCPWRRRSKQMGLKQLVNGFSEPNIAAICFQNRSGFAEQTVRVCPIHARIVGVLIDGNLHQLRAGCAQKLGVLHLRMLRASRSTSPPSSAMQAGWIRPRSFPPCGGQCPAALVQVSGTPVPVQSQSSAGRGVHTNSNDSCPASAPSTKSLMHRTGVVPARRA